MKCYRVVHSKARTTDLSGTGASLYGGRWNSKGTYMLYTSETSSLAYLETLVHFDQSLFPPHLFMITIDIPDTAAIYELKDTDYPDGWLTPGLIANQQLGDAWMTAADYLGIKVKSAINTMEYNYLLNPLFPGYSSLVKVAGVTPIDIDERLGRK